MTVRRGSNRCVGVRAMPNASVSTAVVVNPGFRANVRHANRTSLEMSSRMRASHRFAPLRGSIAFMGPGKVGLCHATRVDQHGTRDDEWPCQPNSQGQHRLRRRWCPPAARRVPQSDRNYPGCGTATEVDVDRGPARDRSRLRRSCEMRIGFSSKPFWMTPKLSSACETFTTIRMPPSS